mgnify:CR=1 FL=1
MDAGLIGRLLPGQTFTVPQRYGLTIGELISYLRVYLPFFKLTIIKMSAWYQIQDNEWVLSSPNVPTLDTVLVYSGLGIMEDTSVSLGRGTTKPFQLTGNPGVNARDVLDYFKKNVIQLQFRAKLPVTPLLSTSVRLTSCLPSTNTSTKCAEVQKYTLPTGTTSKQ